MTNLDTLAGTAAGGTLYGVGVGPGDVRYLTLRAAGLVRAVDVLAYFAKKGLPGNARRIVTPLIVEGRTERRFEYPMTDEMPAESADYQFQMGAFYRATAEALAGLLRQGKSVGLLAEGSLLLRLLHAYVAPVGGRLPGRGRARRHRHVGLLDARQPAHYLGQ